MSEPDDIYTSDAVFRRRMEELTGLSWGDIGVLAEAQEQREHERIQAAGFCCAAGLVASPGPCPWHPDYREEWRP